MDYSICVDLQKMLKSAQMVYSIVKDVYLSVLVWIIALVLILRKCCHQHNPDFQSQNAKKDLFGDGSLRLCWSSEKLEDNTNTHTHCKTRDFDRFAMDYCICADIEKML